MSQPTPLTKQGAERLREELNRLKKVDRPKVIEAIAEARAHGDLKENAEYHAAREQQGFIEGRIKELEASLSNSRIIDTASLDVGDKVVFGAHVTLQEDADDAEHEGEGVVPVGERAARRRRRSHRRGTAGNRRPGIQHWLAQATCGHFIRGTQAARNQKNENGAEHRP